MCWLYLIFNRTDDSNVVAIVLFLLELVTSFGIFAVYTAHPNYPEELLFQPEATFLCLVSAGRPAQKINTNVMHCSKHKGVFKSTLFDSEPLVHAEYIHMRLGGAGLCKGNRIR
jgi:hypothetical protein